jgi:hypothetical protein
MRSGSHIVGAASDGPLAATANTSAPHTVVDPGTEQPEDVHVTQEMTRPEHAGPHLGWSPSGVWPDHEPRQAPWWGPSATAGLIRGR